jgi:hypothetical protein
VGGQCLLLLCCCYSQLRQPAASPSPPATWGLPHQTLPLMLGHKLLVRGIAICAADLEKSAKGEEGAERLRQFVCDDELSAERLIPRPGGLQWMGFDWRTGFKHLAAVDRKPTSLLHTTHLHNNTALYSKTQSAWQTQLPAWTHRRPLTPLTQKDTQCYPCTHTHNIGCVLIVDC